MSKKLNTIWAVSGSLGLNCLKEFSDSLSIAVVLTNRGSTQIIEYCSEKDIPVFIGNPRDSRAKEFIEKKNLLDLDFLVSVNYLFLIESDLIKMVNNNAFNIHGSLLPRYRGRTPHVWAIINDEKQVGVTLHYIDEGCDTGDIIIQEKIVVLDTDTGNSILEKYQKTYPNLIQKLIEAFKSGTIPRKKQDHSIATSFPKRTPIDGLINWNSSSRELYNWIRAQAFPYPGAFTFHHGKKLVVDLAKEENNGSLENGSPGEVLEVREGSILVRTKDSSIELIDFRGDSPINFKVGDILKSEEES